jgi:hypothetical protein
VTSPQSHAELAVRAETDKVKIALRPDMAITMIAPFFGQGMIDAIAG